MKVPIRDFAYRMCACADFLLSLGPVRNSFLIGGKFKILSYPLVILGYKSTTINIIPLEISIGGRG